MDAMAIPLGGVQAVIQVLPEYEPGLYKIGDNSHLWILSWFGQASRSILRVSPTKVNPSLPERGVFAMRSAARPNPIALTLVKLERVEGCQLFVRDYDAVEGTAVLDIKPYFEPDIIFSPAYPVPAAERPSSAAKTALARGSESSWRNVPWPGAGSKDGHAG